MTYPFIDMHCDTLMKVNFDKDRRGLMEASDRMVDFRRMKAGGQMAQFFAVFLPTEDWFRSFGVPPAFDTDYVEACFDIFRREVGERPDIIAQARNAADIERNWNSGKMSAVLTIEDGREVDGRMERLDQYKAAGVTALSLTWNSYNCFGAPNSRNASIMQDGLTAFGRDAVAHMQEIGIIVDVSHLSDGGFRDVARIASKPFVATHSNCRAISPHPRNLTDEMIRELADAGGVMGINFLAGFLKPDTKSKESRVADMVEHAKHERKVGGIDVIALGSDFDGFDGDLEITGPDDMHLLADALSDAGFTGSEIEKIFYSNVMRVMRETVG